MRLFPLGLLSLFGCDSDKSITVQNPTPKADIISHEDGAEVLEGFETLFVGSVTDSNHNPDELTTIWYSNGEIICDGLIPDLYGQTQCFITLGADENDFDSDDYDSAAWLAARCLSPSAV